MTAPLPVVFVSHGSPMHALDAGAAGEAWAALGRELPRPRAIVIVSAHWETDVPALTGAARPQTIHDFYGFPEPLYRIRYPAPGAPALAARAAALLEGAGLAAEVDPARGLDHGAWSPLLHAYPRADVPVVQLSLQSALGTRHHLALGRALAPLAGEGVLLIGSGHMTHNLRDWVRSGQVAPLAYAQEFQAWVADRVAARELEALADYRARAPHAVRAHPSEEHFLPLFFALGAAAEHGRAERLYDGIEGGALAMDAWLFRPAGA
ncbi:MAG TPA: class III extradiol ring-cleavage dioxygenase [Burkholderiales bacterium]|nr:class III extradiol ring-cleavage dioxygenase [Burkholderiales bacterium]